MTTYTRNYTVRHIGSDLTVIEERVYKTEAGMRRWCQQIIAAGCRARGEWVQVETTVVAAEPDDRAHRR